MLLLGFHTNLNRLVVSLEDSSWRTNEEKQTASSYTACGENLLENS